MRPAHIMAKTPKTRGYPKRIIAFDTETHPRPDDPEHTELTLGWATYHTRGLKRGYRPTDKDVCEFTTPEQFWDFVETKLIKQAPTYLVAHNVFFDAANVHFTTQLTARGFTPTEQFVPDSSGPFRMTFHRDDTTLVIIDSGNWYVGKTVRAIGDLLGFPKGDVDAADPKYWPTNGCAPGTQEWQDLSYYCRRDTDIVAKAIDSWCEFCEINDLGPSGMTLPGQAMKAFKHRFMEHEIHLHDNEKVTALEKEGYFGGLTDNFKVGNWKDTLLYITDVKSMYPSIMTEVKVPIRLLAHRVGQRIGADAHTGSLSPEGRVDWARTMIAGGYALVARVRIHSLERVEDDRWLACVPLLKDSKLLYPIGAFTTVLNTPELHRALERGLVVDVLEVAVYEQAAIFKAYVEYFFDKRIEYITADNSLMADLCKLFMNGLYGKFAQCVYEWLNVAVDLGGDRTEKVIDVDTGAVSHYRQMAGVCQKRSLEKQVSQDTFIAIAGHITSASRAKLRGLIETAGFDNVGYCDTDSVFTNQDGYDRLDASGILKPKGQAKLGELEVELIADEMDLNTLKDYAVYRNGVCVKTRLKGVRKDAVRGDVIMEGNEKVFVPSQNGNAWQQTQFQRIAGALRDGTLDTVKISKIIKRPTHLYSKGIVDPWGTVWPHRVEEN